MNLLAAIIGALGKFKDFFAGFFGMLYGKKIEKLEIENKTFQQQAEILKLRDARDKKILDKWAAIRRLKPLLVNPANTPVREKGGDESAVVISADNDELRSDRE